MKHRRKRRCTSVRAKSSLHIAFLEAKDYLDIFPSAEEVDSDIFSFLKNPLFGKEDGAVVETIVKASKKLELFRGQTVFKQVRATDMNDYNVLPPTLSRVTT